MTNYGSSTPDPGMPNYGDPAMSGYNDPSFGGGGVQHSLLERLQGVATFNADMYREIADDESATMTAGLIVAGVSAFGGFVNGLLTVPQLMMQAQSPELQQQLAEIGIDLSSLTALGGLGIALALILAFVSPLLSLIGWIIGSAIYAFIANAFFRGEATTGRIMRTLGFANIFQLVTLVPCVGSLAAFVLGAVSAVFSIRESSRFTTTNAVITWLTPTLIIVVFCCLVSGLLFALGAAAGSN